MRRPRRGRCADGPACVSSPAPARPQRGSSLCGSSPRRQEGSFSISLTGSARVVPGLSCARYAGKHEVQNNQIEVVLGKFLEGVLAIADGRHPVVFTLEICGNRIADSLLVLDKHDAASLIAHVVSLHVSCRIRILARDRTRVYAFGFYCSNWGSEVILVKVK